MNFSRCFSQYRAVLWFATSAAGQRLAVALLVAALVPWGKASAYDGGAAGQPAVWQVSDADSTVTLFGTFHLLPADAEWQTERVRAAFGRADVLVLEAPVSDQPDPEIVQFVQANGVNPPGVVLSQRLDGPWTKRYADVLGMLQIPAQAVEPLRPWYASLVLTVQFAAHQGMKPEYGVESQLNRLADQRRMGRAYLETARGQVEMMAFLPPGIQDEMLKSTLLDIQNTDQKMGQMAKAWTRGDLPELERLVLGSMKQMPDLYTTLIVERNRDWLPQIETFLADDKDYFVAVGSGHLIGDDSVIAMLRARGQAVAGP